MQGRGATSVILGCTELPLILHQKDVDAEGLAVRVFETTTLHAEKAVALSLGDGIRPAYLSPVKDAEASSPAGFFAGSKPPPVDVSTSYLPPVKRVMSSPSAGFFVTSPVDASTQTEFSQEHQHEAVLKRPGINFTGNTT